MTLPYSTRNGTQTPDSLIFKDTSFIGNVIGAGVNVLDADINLISFIQAENMAELNRQRTPSGWITEIASVLQSGVQGNIQADGTVANQLSIIGDAEAMVNGYRLKVTRTADGTDNKITLNAPPATGARVDLVFLEAWLMEIKDAASTGSGVSVTGTQTGPFTFSAGNKQLDMAINGGTEQAITFTEGSQTITDVVNTINTTFSGLASDDGTGKLKLSTTNRIDIKATSTALAILGLTAGVYNASATQSDNRIAGLLDDGTFATFGNVDYYGTSLRNGGLVFDQIDPAVVVETNRRIQVQYRTRVVDGVDIATYLEGLDDMAKVKAWPTNKRDSSDGVSETTYTFSKSSSDPGLYVAGDGSSTAKTDIGCLDGYVYAIPICAVHRRNTTAHDQITNDNGAGAAIGGSSDRPDGLFNDEINVRDVVDLRHQISLTGLDHQQLLEKSMDLLLRGDLNTNFGVGDGVGNSVDVRGTRLVYSEQLGGSDVNNVNNRIAGVNPNILNMKPNGQRRGWSDEASSENNHAKVSQTTTTLPANVNFGAIRAVGSGAWAQNDVIRITTESWANIDSASVKVLDESGNDVTSEFTIGASSSTVDCTVNAASPTFSAETNLHTVYDVTYPVGGGLFNLPSNMLRVEDGAGSLVFGDSGLWEENDYSSLNTTDELVRWNNVSRFGAYLLFTETATVNNQITITLPASYSAAGIESVKNDTTSTQLETNVSSWSQSAQDVTINFSSGVAVGNDVIVGVYVDVAFLRFQEETRAILGVYETKEVSVTVDGSGNGTAYLNTNEVGLQLAAMYNGTKNIRDASNNVAMATTVVVSEHQVTVTGCSAVSQAVKVNVVAGKTLLNNESLRLWYEYAPYQAVLQGEVSGSTSKAYSEAVVSNGTGGFASRVIVPHLPMSSNFNDYDFTPIHLLGFSYNNDVYAFMGKGILEYEIGNAATYAKTPSLSLGAAGVTGSRTYANRLKVDLGLESNGTYFVGVSSKLDFSNPALLLMAGYMQDKMLVGTFKLTKSQNMVDAADGATGAFYMLGRPLER